MHQEVLGDKQKKIFPYLKNFNKFYLAGGTALALQIGHRVSVDFDLFSGEGIKKTLLTKIQKIFVPEIPIVSVNNSDELTIFINEVKVTFLRYPFPILFDLIQYKNISFLSIKEIAVTKAYTIGRRGSFKDYIDLFFILSGKYITLNEIITLAEKKYGKVFHARLFLEQLIYLEDIEDTEIIFSADRITKKQIKQFFIGEIKKIKL